MSANSLRIRFKKLAKKATDSKANGKQLPKEVGRRKALSAATAPEVVSISPQLRKPGTDSPVHSVMGRGSGCVSLVPMPSVSSSTSSLARRESNPSFSVGGGASGPAPPGLPRVNVSYEDQPLDRQGIISITADVQNFLAAILRLRKAIEEADNEDGDTDDEAPTAVMNNLRELILAVHTCLGEHPGMQSTEIKDAAKNLRNSYQTCTHHNASTCASCNEAIETLIGAFTSSVHQYLTGDGMPPEMPQHEHRRLPRATFSSTNLLKGLSKSHDNLASRYSSVMDLSQQAYTVTDQIDQALGNSQDSVDVATKYIELRTRYHAKLTTHLSKRAQIELRYQQQMAKLAKSTKSVLDEFQGQEDCLPLIDLFRTSVDQDMRFAMNCNTTYNSQVGSKVIDPLRQRSEGCDRMNKELNQTWQRELKKLTEAKSAMKNVKAKYRFYGEELARVKNLLAMDPYGKQAEKRKKEVSDLEVRWQEAQAAYKTAVADCNDCQYQVHAVAQKSILCAYRRMVIDLDVVLKSGLESYFQLQYNFFKSLPEPMNQSLMDSRDYDIGTDFVRYIHRNPEQMDELEDYLFEEYDPEAEELQAAMVDSPENSTELSHLPTSNSTESHFLTAEDPIRRAASPLPLHVWDTTSTALNDTSAALSSPSAGKKKKRPNSMAFLIDPNFDPPRNHLSRRNSDHTQQSLAHKDPVSSPPASSSFGPEEPLKSKNALTHTLRVLRGPARCRECDTYVYFHGYECEVCGLACHKKCLATLGIQCGTKRLARKMTTFGVEFQKHLRATKRYIPIIVTRCIAELDERGLDYMGLYRVSSAKTKIEHLCQLFESGADRVDLSDRPPHLIGSCLKLYFRQLPQPLLTFELYPEFISFARNSMHVLPCDLEAVDEEKKAMALQHLSHLSGLLQKLPYENYITLARLLYHLSRVGSPEYVKCNRMPPSNLGIVFGPNLLRQKDMVASLALLKDMTAQAKAIEILISHVKDVFHVSEEQVIREHENEYEDSVTTEVLVDEAADPIRPVRSPQLDVDDALTTGSRTPFNTPPERRRENVFELGEVLDALKLVASGRPPRSSYLKLPDPHEYSPLRHHYASPSHVAAHHTKSLPILQPYHQQLSGPSLPGTVGSRDSEDTLSSLHRLLRPQPPPFDKMLTPVEERPTEVEENPKGDGFSEDDDDHIVSSESQKLDYATLSRSTSGLSNPSVGGAGDLESESSSMRDYDPEVSSISNLSTGPGMGILGGGFDGPPILSSTHSLELPDSGSHSQDNENFKEDITRLLHGNDEPKEGQDSSQGSDDSSPFSSENVKALLDREGSPPFSPHTPSFSSSGEGTPIRTTMPPVRRRVSSTDYSSDLSYPSLVSPRHFPFRRHPYPARNASMDCYLRQYAAEVTNTSSPHSSNLSSISRATMSSQGSFSETLGDELSSRETTSVQHQGFEHKTNDTSVDSEKGEQKEGEEGEDYVEVEVDSTEVNGMDRSQDSNTTIQDLGNGAVVETAATSEHQQSERVEQDSRSALTPLSSVRDNRDQNGEVSSESEEEEEEEEEEEKEEEEEERRDREKVSIDQERRIQLLKEAHRHMDSGIEEVESKLESSNSLEGEDGSDDIPLPDESKPLRHYTTIFASRESGLADSPDLYAIEHSKQPFEVGGDTKRGSHVDLEITFASSPPKLSRPSQSSLQSNNTFDVGPDMSSLADLEDDESGERLTELESSLDNRYLSREMGQFSEFESSLDSKYLQGVPLEEERRRESPLSRSGNGGRRTNRREREATSRDSRSPSKASETDSTRASPGPTESSRETKKRQFQSERSRSLASLSPPPFFVGSSSMSSSGPTSPEAGGNRPPKVRSSSIGSGGWGSRKRRKIRPAVRLLRISPSRSIANQSGLSSASEDVFPSDVAAKESSEVYEVQMARMRMRSPETPSRDAVRTGRLRRSQSHELLSDGCTSGNQKQISTVGTVFASPASSISGRVLHVMPTESLPQPSEGTDRSRRFSVDSIGSNPKSPRGRKRSRTPQFV